MLSDLITSNDAATRDKALAAACKDFSLEDLLAEAEKLDKFRRSSDNLYHRVRAIFFLNTIHRYHIPNKLPEKAAGQIPFSGHQHLLERRFQEAIDTFLAAQQKEGPSDALSSALAASYHQLAFQTLADQVRKSVRTVRGNQWMFRMGHPSEHPLRFRSELLETSSNGTTPILLERTPVRMDLTHSAWSDIFFLGMDFPEGAKVINVSVDLGVHGRDAQPAPPVEAYIRVIDEPVIKLTSVDLKASATIDNLGEIFDFAKDHLGLLKAAIIASGVVPPGVEGSGQSLAYLLEKILGKGRGIELVSSVNNIPKGSRLAVSTNLLAALIGALMRATGQTQSLTGPLQESERRIVLARAILGEWLGGSGGGWQDSGGVWPGIKLISGHPAVETDPEHGISRGRLMPTHKVFTEEEIPDSARQALQDSLVLVHGGMAQNVGPILEMVTEKYLLRSDKEWAARKQALALLDQLIEALKKGDIKAMGTATTQNFYGPLQTIIPWATNLFTETVIARTFQHFGEDFWGFWMLGGMSGGGMGFIFAPHRKAEAQIKLAEIMLAEKKRLEKALPFAMDPVVYDFAINPYGTQAEFVGTESSPALFPPDYYQIHIPTLMEQTSKTLTPLQKKDLTAFRQASLSNPIFKDSIHKLFETLLPEDNEQSGAHKNSLPHLLETNGFDQNLHESIRADILNGRLGLAQNRISAHSVITDVEPDDVFDATSYSSAGAASIGESAIRNGEIAVVTLAAGAGSRWTGGAGTCKALNPFAPLDNTFRTFLEVHLAKSRLIGKESEQTIPHIFTTSYLTHSPTQDFLEAVKNYQYPGTLLLSKGQSVGQRMIPTERDLRFAWEETAQQRLDEQQEKVRESGRAALINWAKESGQASDYTDNLPLQCLHPVGHFFEISNLILNGTLKQLLEERPQLRTLLLHNIDTLGANIDPTLLGLHRQSGQGLTFEVIHRRLEDRGGGLARVNNVPRLVEGLAMPDEEAEFNLSYYNTLTTWIDINQFLKLVGISRQDILDNNTEKIQTALRNLAKRLPTYITLKDVKKRWGHGQEDVFPVTQFEKLWGDLTTLPEANCGYFIVPRLRGQQLKDPAQLDGWLQDGSAQYVESICAWS